jgi:hypothetical protein
MVELAAELADVRDAQRQHARPPDLDVARAEERERLVRDVVARHALQELARARSGEREHAVAGGHVVDQHRAVVGSWRSIQARSCVSVAAAETT